MYVYVPAHSTFTKYFTIWTKIAVHNPLYTTYIDTFKYALFYIIVLVIHI